MTTTTFVDKETKIATDWLNDADAVVYQALGNGADVSPTTPAEVRTNIDVNSATDLASTTTGKGAALVGIEDAAANFTATTVEGALAEQVSNLASTANGKGAALVGVEDAATNFTATTVEGVLAEIQTDVDTRTVATTLASTANGNGAALVGVEDASSYFTGTTVEAVLTELHEGNTLTSGTVTDTSTSAASYDYTSIPSWVKKITITFAGVSTNGTSIPMIQIGDSGGIETTGYLSASTYIKLSSGVTVNGTTGFRLIGAHAATALLGGSYTLSLLDSSTNTWAFSGTCGDSADTVTGWCGGSKALSATLDRVRLTTVNGTDTFDAGKINILYE